MSDLKATTIEATTKDPSPKVTIRLNGELGNIVAGGNGQEGNLVLFAKAATGDTLHDPHQANIRLDAKSGELRGQSLVLNVPGKTFGTKISTGSVALSNILGGTGVELSGEDGNITMRGRSGSNSGPNLKLFDGSDTQRIHLDGHKGNISLTGDIFLNGADCAEDFAVTPNSTAGPGTVVVIQDEEHLAPSQKAYDRRVAGVISGAGSYKPGIVLNRKDENVDHQPVALMGRTYCKADAQYSAIEIGDLLTTSPTPGHAMKAVDPHRAFGAVIGKALQPLKEGRGLIPILVAMQ